MNPSTEPLATRFLFGRQHASWRLDAGSWVLIVACAALLGWKAWAIWRLNINWDEFYFLTHIHALLRGDLEIPFQTTYTQAFRWLPLVGDTELPQIHVARICMFLLLALSVWQIVRLAARWVSPGAALLAAIAFLCALPVQMHGASFRSDSLLLPVLLGALLLLTRPVISRRAEILAGVLCGIGIAVSVKMALFAPLLLACVLLAPATEGSSRLRTMLLRCLVVGAVALGVAAVLIGLHQLALKSPELESASSFASRSMGKTLLETRFLPGELYLRHLFRADRFIWIAIGVGFLLSIGRRRWLPAAMLLSLSPLLYYRNTFPYFYVDMLAPAVVVIGVIVDELRALARRGAQASTREWLPIACGVLLLVHGGSRLPLLSMDEQRGQRAVLDAVHQIFPRPVPYLDHAGMVSTYRKVNFFMSTWGMEEYRRRGTPFMAPMLREHRPPLLVVNRDYLDVRMRDARHLMPEDFDALQRFYQPYWGPIYVAGASARLAAGETQALALPFPGRFRIESPGSVLVDGVLRAPGDVIETAATEVRIALPPDAGGAALVRLLTAEAGPPPTEAPAISYIFTGL